MISQTRLTGAAIEKRTFPPSAMSISGHAEPGPKPHVSSDQATVRPLTYTQIPMHGCRNYFVGQAPRGEPRASVAATAKIACRALLSA